MPDAPQNVAPPAPPAAPTPPQYGAPSAVPAPPTAPQYGAPPAGGYQPPPAGGYQQPPAAPADAALSNITLNYWLSAFFAWIPALIFWVIEKDKGNHRATAFHVSNLNFSLLRTAAGIGISILSFIPYIGWLLAALLWIGSIVLFVFHIMAAVKAAENYKNGGSTDPFIFNVQMIK